jgi:hypothetical protein
MHPNQTLDDLSVIVNMSDLTIISSTVSPSRPLSPTLVHVTPNRKLNLPTPTPTPTSCSCLSLHVPPTAASPLCDVTTLYLPIHAYFLGLRRDHQISLIFIRLYIYIRRRRIWVWVLTHRPEFEAGPGPSSGSFDQTPSEFEYTDTLASLEKGWRPCRSSLPGVLFFTE